MPSLQPPVSELVLQQSICDYLRMAYRQALWRSDYASGLKLSMHQAVQHKQLQSGRAWPDIMVYEPVGTYQGLCIELKREDVKVFKQDGSLRADPHLQEQAAVLEDLRQRGYKAEFACGFDQAKKVIDDYFASGTWPAGRR